MRKSNIFIIIIIVIVLGLIAWWMYSRYSYNKNKSNEESINSERLSTEITINSQTAQNLQNAQIANNEALNAEVSKQETLNAEAEAARKANPTETEIASCSTKLLDRSSGRLTNIRITCAAINGKKVSVGETFSFNSIVGQSTEAKGYKKASVIVDKKSTQALGGGNCQVSSTLYDAVLKVPDLKVIERHEHGKDVAYVDDGKDAAVAYGSLDFKFKNNTSNDIKIYISSDNKNVTARLVKLTY